MNAIWKICVTNEVLSKPDGLKEKLKEGPKEEQKEGPKEEQKEEPREERKD